VGPPGTGKSLVAKSVATAWGVPLLKLDLGALKGKFVGESEGNVRKAFRVVEAVGRAILWIDEIEKSLAGATQGAADGGVSADALGTILQWMSDRPADSGAFVVATANDASVLPPELIRAGRFDCLFFCDLPNRTERGQILKTSLRTYKRDAINLDYGDIIDATDGFTGSEIAAIIPDAMFKAFADGGREIATGDVLASAKSVVPLSKTASEKIEKLRDWAKGRARPATKIETVVEMPKARAGGRAIDI
jgi:SpoVK/Ycf46/Vps4 family AAA+-type ATPase